MLTCNTTEGAGGLAIVWVVTVSGQESSAPATSAAAPVVDAVELFDVESGVRLPLANVSGGFGLRVRGKHFTLSAERVDWVRYGLPGAEMYAHDCRIAVAHEAIECTAPSGGGRDLPDGVHLRAAQRANGRRGGHARSPARRPRGSECSQRRRWRATHAQRRGARAASA